MKPYYDHDGITIYHGDCREVLPHIGAVNAVITDPPFGQTSLKWDVRCDGWVPLLQTDSLWFFGSMKFGMEMASDLSAAGWKYAQEVVWEKHNGSNFHADRFRRVHEFAFHWYRGKWSALRRSTPVTHDAVKRQVRRKGKPPHMNPIEDGVYASDDGGPLLMRSVIPVRSCHGYALHRTQKPTGIVEPLVEYSVPVGGALGDPFMGSGTMLVVARSMGRRAIGIELNEADCETAAKRLEQSTLPFAEAGE